MPNGQPLPPDELGPRLSALFRAVGPLYRHAARQVAEAESIEGVSTGVRAVLEQLHVAGPQTVPGIARAVATSRQYVQRMTNEAAERDLVITADNPTHRRSSLVELTPAGQATIERILTREHIALAAVGEGLTDAEVATCTAVLERLVAGLEPR